MALLALLLLAQQTAFVPILGLHDRGVFNRFAPFVALSGAEGYAPDRVGLMLNLHQDVLHVTVDRVPVSVIPMRLVGEDAALRWFRRRSSGAVFAVSALGGSAAHRVVRLRLLSRGEAKAAATSHKIGAATLRRHARARRVWVSRWRKRPADERLALIGSTVLRCPAAICLEIPSLTLEALLGTLEPKGVLVIRRLQWPSDRDQDGIHDQVDTLIGAKKLVLNKAQYREGFQYIKWPMGDVPPDRGVCTDVLIRALRNAGIDLQVLLQRHIAGHRASYPWIERRSPNIDHRRVRNLLIYFKARAELISTGITETNKHLYLPGDILFMDTRPKKWGPDHVGIVSDHRNARGYPLVINNRGRGPHQYTAELDMLPTVRVTHHFRLR